MEKIDILVGIPTLNEQENIASIVSIVDKGLTYYFPNRKSFIVNVDSASNDLTREAFIKTETATMKNSINCGRLGKGKNIFKLLEISVEKNADFVCMLDGDLKSVQENWIYKLVSPLINTEADYVVPVYRRNRYESNTTNHFCFPIISSLYKTPIRQPIAGDFGFNRKFVNYILKKERILETNQYGIDIYLTTHAASGDFSIKEVFLGEKIHNPSFGKMVPMFEQVATTMYFRISQYKNDHCISKSVLIEESQVKRTGMSEYQNKPSNQKLRDREKAALEFLDKWCERDTHFKSLLRNHRHSYESEKRFSLRDWCQFLATAINSKDTTPNTLAEITLPLYLLRVLTYFREIEGKSAAFADTIITKTVEELTHALHT